MCLDFDCHSTNHDCSISGFNSLLAGSAPKSLVCSAMAPKNQGQEPAAPKRASKDEGMDPTAISRMLGHLKYRADPERNKKGSNGTKEAIETVSTASSSTFELHYYHEVFLARVCNGCHQLQQHH